MWRMTVRHIQKADLAGRHFQGRRCLKRLVMTKPPQSIVRMRARLGMGLCAISDNDNVDFSAKLGCFPDQSATSQAFVVRMRRHHQQRPIFYHFSEINVWQEFDAFKQR